MCLFALSSKYYYDLIVYLSFLFEHRCKSPLIPITGVQTKLPVMLRFHLTNKTSHIWCTLCNDNVFFSKILRLKFSFLSSCLALIAFWISMFSSLYLLEILTVIKQLMRHLTLNGVSPSFGIGDIVVLLIVATIMNGGTHGSAV